MARPHPISPVLAVIATVAASIGLGFAVFAQTPEDIFGSPDQTPDQTSNTSIFNQCVTGVCEPQRAKCVSDAGSDSARLALCESYVTACLDACRAGSTAYKFPPLPVAQPVLEPEPEPEPEEPVCSVDDWQCGDWSVCTASGSQTRTCKLAVDCPSAATPAPLQTRKCQPPDLPTEDDADDRVEDAPEDLPPPADERQEATEAPQDSGEEERADWSEGLRSSVDDFEKDIESASAGFGLSGPADDDASDDTADAAADRIDACSALGLDAAVCRQELIDGLGFEDCAAAGHQTRESCVAFLIEENDGVFPGCEGLTPEQCRGIQSLKTIEYLPADLKRKADDVLREAVKGGTVIALDGITAINEETTAAATWRTSYADEDQETSAAVIVLDADKDGLPDDFEAATGIDTPEKAEASDLDETSQALVSGAPLQQPRGAGKVEPTFYVQVPYSGQLASDADFRNDAESGSGDAVSAAGSVDRSRNENWDFEGSAGRQAASRESGASVKISGKCLPDTTCLIYVYSYIPMVLTVKADENGNFEYDIAKNVADGSHVAYVAVTDKTGKVTKKSNPLSFLVKDAQAASAEEFLASPLPTPAAPEESLAGYYWIGASVLVLLAAGLVWQIRRKPGAVA
jgi:hypothetical protein